MRVNREPVDMSPEGTFIGDTTAVKYQTIDAAGPVILGDGVEVNCRHIRVGAGCTVGIPPLNRMARYARTTIDCDELHLGDGVTIEPGVQIRGGLIKLDRLCRVGQGTFIDVASLMIGARGTIHEECELVGRDISIGRELWMLTSAKIGGGSAKDIHSTFRAGDFLHLGVRTLINTADAVTIGHEVGLGTGTAIYTHGAYLSSWDGFPVRFAPVSIGSNTWLPGAIVNPGVSIGSNCVVGVGSLVNRDIPDGALALGVPARVIGRPFPQQLSPSDRMHLMTELLTRLSEILASRRGYAPEVANEAEVRVTLPDNSSAIAYRHEWGPGDIAALAGIPRLVLLAAGDITEAPSRASITRISLHLRRVTGTADELSERVLNQLRRYGIRFRYEAVGEGYRPWT